MCGGWKISSDHRLLRKWGSTNDRIHRPLALLPISLITEPIGQYIFNITCVIWIHTYTFFLLLPTVKRTLIKILSPSKTQRKNLYVLPRLSNTRNERALINTTNHNIMHSVISTWKTKIYIKGYSRKIGKKNLPSGTKTPPFKRATTGPFFPHLVGVGRHAHAYFTARPL